MQRFLAICAYKGKLCVIFTAMCGSLFPQFWSRILAICAYKGKLWVKTRSSFCAHFGHVFRPQSHIRENKWSFFAHFGHVFSAILHIRGKYVTLLHFYVMIVFTQFRSQISHQNAYKDKSVAIFTRFVYEISTVFAYKGETWVILTFFNKTTHLQFFPVSSPARHMFAINNVHNFLQIYPDHK